MTNAHRNEEYQIKINLIGQGPRLPYHVATKERCLLAVVSLYQ